jgi:hypothetical protein
MSDSRFHILIIVIVCLLAAGELAYGMFGPFMDGDHRATEFSSINRTH